MGDLIVSTPAIELIKQTFPDAEITYVLSGINCKIINDPRGKVIIYHKQWSMLKKITLIASIMRQSYDLAICMSPKHFAYLLTYLSFSPSRYAMIYTSNRLKAFLLSQLFHHSLTIDRYHLTSHSSKHHGKRIQELILPLTQKTTPMQYTIAYHNQPIIPTGFIGIHLDQRWKCAGWTTTQLSELFTQLKQSSHYPIVVTANLDSYPELAAGNTIYKQTDDLSNIQVDPHACTIIDQAPYHAWVNIIQRARLWLTAEGGSVHVSAAVNTDCVTWIDTRLYGRANHRPSASLYQNICDEWLLPNKHHPIFHSGSIKQLHQNILHVVLTRLNGPQYSLGD